MAWLMHQRSLDVYPYTLNVQNVSETRCKRPQFLSWNILTGADAFYIFGVFVIRRTFIRGNSKEKPDTPLIWPVIQRQCVCLRREARCRWSRTRDLRLIQVETTTVWIKEVFESVGFCTFGERCCTWMPLYNGPVSSGAKHAGMPSSLRRNS